MKNKIRTWKTKWFWMAAMIFLLDFVLPFIPIVAAWVLICAIIPQLGVLTAKKLIEHYNRVQGTNFEILDISRASDDIGASAVRPD